MQGYQQAVPVVPSTSTTNNILCHGWKIITYQVYFCIYISKIQVFYISQYMHISSLTAVQLCVNKIEYTKQCNDIYCVMVKSLGIDMCLSYVTKGFFR